MSVMRPVDVLVKAKELLNAPDGYRKRMLCDGHGGYCAIGALMGAVQGTKMVHGWSSRDGVDLAAYRYLMRVNPNPVHTNNTTDLATVNKMFCAAIALVAEEETSDE